MGVTCKNVKGYENRSSFWDLGRTPLPKYLGSYYHYTTITQVSLCLSVSLSLSPSL